MKTGVVSLKAIQAWAMIAFAIGTAVACSERGGFDASKAASEGKYNDGTPAIYGACAGLITQEQIDTFLKFNHIESIAYVTGIKPTTCRSSDNPDAKEIPAFENLILTPAHRLLPEYKIVTYKDDENTQLATGTKGIIAYLYLSQETVTQADAEAVAAVFKISGDLHKRFEVRVPEWQGVFVGALPDLLVNQYEAVNKDAAKITTLALALHPEIVKEVEQELISFKNGEETISLFALSKNSMAHLLRYEVKANEELATSNTTLSPIEAFLIKAWQTLEKHKSQFLQLGSVSPAFESLLRKTNQLLPRIQNRSESMNVNLRLPLTESEKIWTEDKPSQKYAYTFYEETLKFLKIMNSDIVQRMNPILDLIRPYYPGKEDEAQSISRRLAFKDHASVERIQLINSVFDRMRALRPDVGYPKDGKPVLKRSEARTWTDVEEFVASHENDPVKVQETLSLIEYGELKGVKLEFSKLTSIALDANSIKTRIDMIAAFRKEYKAPFDPNFERVVFDENMTAQKTPLYFEALRFVFTDKFDESVYLVPAIFFVKAEPDPIAFKSFVILYRWLTLVKKLSPEAATFNSSVFIKSRAFTFETKSRIAAMLGSANPKDLVEVQRFVESIFGSNFDIKIAGSK